MDQIAEATAWLAACAEAAKAIGDHQTNAVRDGVRLVYDPPTWAHTQGLNAIYRRGRQMIYDVMASMERQGRLLALDGEIDRLREDSRAIVSRALALSRLVVA